MTRGFEYFCVARLSGYWRAGYVVLVKIVGFARGIFCRTVVCIRFVSLRCRAGIEGCAPAEHIHAQELAAFPARHCVRRRVFGFGCAGWLDGHVGASPFQIAKSEACDANGGG